MIVHGHSIPSLPDAELFELRKKFGVLFQDGALFGSMNLYDNVAFPLRQHTEKGEDEIAEIVNRRLNEVGLGNANEKMPNELSGGMRKRAGFARALVLEPDIVLFDEPDSGPRPGAHRAAVRADQGSPRRERRLLRGDHPRHHERAPRGRAHLGAVEGQDRRIGPGRRSCSPPKTRSCASSSPANRPGRSAWSERRRRRSLRELAAALRARRRRRAAAARWCSRSPRCSALGGAAARAAPAPDRRDEHVRLELERRLPRHPALLPQLRRRAGRGARQGQPAAARAELGHRAAASASRAACRATCPATALAQRGRRERALRAARAREHGQGRVRPGHVPQRGGRPDRRTAHRADARGRSAGQAGRTGRRQTPRWRAATPRHRRTRSARRPSKLDDSARFQESLVTLALQYGLTARPSIDDPNFVSTLVFDSAKPAGTPKQRFAYLFPSRNAALDLGAHEGRALAKRSARARSR